MIKTFIRNQRSLFSAICDLFGCSEYDNPWSEEVIAEKKKQKLPCTAELAEAQKLHGQLKRLEWRTQLARSGNGGREKPKRGENPRVNP